MQLLSFPCAPAPPIQIECGWRSDHGNIELQFVLRGDTQALQLPRYRAARRSDGLWRTTCFEWFIAEWHGAGYLEFNFAPCGGWQAYRFDSCRAGRRELSVGTYPRIAVQSAPDEYVMRVQLDRDLIIHNDSGPARSPRRMAFSAIVEDDAGHLSYWALAHPTSQPDFHCADGFIVVGEF